MSTTITLERETFAATLTEHADAGDVTLTWHDYVVNEWTEHYDSLAEGLVRLALLDLGVRSGSFFTTTPDDFAPAVRSFLSRHLS